MPDTSTTRPPTAAEITHDAPTRVRWRVLALLMAYAGFCHFNRVSISVAGTEHIMADYAIDPEQMGTVYSSYLFIYTMCMIPGGWLIDRFGPKKALMAMGFGSAILVPATGLTSHATAVSILLLLCLIRGMLGVVSSPMHPAAAKCVSLWMPPRQQGLANGLVTGAAVAGVASTYFAFGFLMDLVGWPNAFLVAGLTTFLLAAVWTLYATDLPGEHRSTNSRELALIEGDEPAGAIIAEAPSRPPFGPDDPDEQGGRSSLIAMLGNRSLILLTLSYATASYFQYLFFYWMQYYFDTVMKLGKADGRLYATITTVAMAVGMMCGGWPADRARIRFGPRRGRAVVPMGGMLASALFLILGISSSHLFWVVTCFTLAMAALGTCESSFWVTGVEIGRKRGGLSSSILNAGGNVGGILAPILTPLFSKSFGWQAGLGAASAFCVFGALLWLWIDPDARRDPRST
ncbi:MFS transporter [Singulisphaera rosea]